MMKFGKYFVEEKERESNTNSAQVYGLTIDFHPLQNDYFDPYVRITNGYSTLKINHIERASNGVILNTDDSKVQVIISKSMLEFVPILVATLG